LARRLRDSPPKSASTSGFSTTAIASSAPSVFPPPASDSSEEALYQLANTACGYVGMIGSKRKIRMIFEDLVAKGISEEALSRVHAPLGYNIGSQTVPEIAVSIVAELIACRNMGTNNSARVSWERKQNHGGTHARPCCGSDT
jgi:hypothetical protein